MRGLEIGHVRVDGHHVLHLRGELDLGSAPTLAGLLEDIEVDGAGGVVLDLADVTFVDSSGLKVVLEANGRAAATQRAFVVRQPQAQARRLIDLSGVDGVLAIEGG